MIGGQDHECGEDAVRGHIVPAVDAGFHRTGRHLRASLMTHQADTDLFHTEQKSEDVDAARPIWLVPGMIGDKYGMAADRLDGFSSAAASNFHDVASRQ